MGRPRVDRSPEEMKARKATYARAYYDRHREACIAYSRKYSKEHKESVLAKSRVYYRKNAHKWKGYSWRKRRLPEPTRERPAACECCGRPEGRKALALDHCHKTNQFRGWLCDYCNTAIGALGDNVESLMRAVRYLRAFEAAALEVDRG